MSQNRYELDLSNEVLSTHFDQRTAKISEVKVGDRKNMQIQPDPRCGGFESG